MDAFNLTDAPPNDEDALRQVMALLGSGPGGVPSVGTPPPAAAPMQGVPASPMPQPPPPSQPHPGVDIRQLIKLVGPLLAAASMKGPAQTGFLNGWSEGQQMVSADKEKKRQEADKKGTASANYVTDVSNQLDQYTDPVQWAQHLDIAKHAAQSGGLDASALEGLSFNKTKQAGAALKELTDQLDQLEKNGYDLDQLAQSGSHLRLKDGTDVPIAAAVNITRKRPLDASGQPIAKPSKVASTEEERFLVKWAKDNGTTADKLTSDQELKARSAFKQAGQAKPAGDDYSRFLDRFAKENGTTVEEMSTDQELKARKAFNGVNRNPQMDDLNLQLAQLRLDGLKQKGADAAAVMKIEPGTKEYRLADDLATGALPFADFNRMLTSRGAGGQNVNAMRMAFYDKAREINPDFNPAMFEIGYKFAASPKVQAQIASVKNVISGVPDLLKASDAAGRSGVTALNKFIVPGGVAVGGKAYTDFSGAAKAFADELSGALGYGSATDMARQMGLDLTNTALSPANFRSQMENIVIPFVNRKKASLLGQMGPYGGGVDGKRNSDEGASPSGSSYKLVNGQWVKQ